MCTHSHETLTKMNETRRKHSEGHDNTGREALIVPGSQGAQVSRKLHPKSLGRAELVGKSSSECMGKVQPRSVHLPGYRCLVGSSGYSR